MYILSDVERMGNLCKELIDSMTDKEDKQYEFSNESIKELQYSLKIIERMYAETLDALESGQHNQVADILKRKEQIIDLDIDMRKAHMNRVMIGKCSARLTAPFFKILHCIDRMGNSCVNMTEVVSAQVDLEYFMIEKEKSANKAESLGRAVVV